MKQDEFTEVVDRILRYWPGEGFKKSWNPENQQIVFKMLSYFRQDEVLEAIEHHKYDNPDEPKPKFKDISNALWAIKKARDAQGGKDQAASLPSWPTIEAWAGRKSDGDLVHLWQLVTKRYQLLADSTDKLWNFLNACEQRSTPCLTICWAVEHNIPLTFNRGTDEWFVVMDEYDRQQRAKEVAEFARRKSKPEPALAVVPAGVSENQDEVPF